MSLFDKARAKLNNNQRAFVTGPSVVQQADVAFGISPEKFSPEKYGDYLATSNSVYAINDRRSTLLSSLPLKLYKFKDNERRHNRQWLKASQHRAITRLRQVAHLPNVFKRTVQAENLEEVDSGMLFELLTKVNPHWTLQRLIQMTDLSLGVWGRSFWALERGRSGKQTPKEIWWAESQWMKVIPDKNDYIKGFKFEGPHFAAQNFSPDEMIWFNKPNPIDQFNPLSPLAAARVYADHENASMQANINLHRQGLQLGGLIWPDGDKNWSKEIAQEIEEDLNRRFRGVSKAHRWGAFRHKIGMKEAGTNPKDAEYLGGMNWDLEAVARAYGWPVDLVGGRRTYQNIDASMVGAYVFAVLPQAAFIASELTEQLLPMFPGDADLLWFDASEVHVLQEAESAKWDREKGQIEVGAITVNEWRAKQGLEPVPWGDTWWASANQLPAGSSPVEETRKRFWIMRQTAPVFSPLGANEFVIDIPPEGDIADTVRTSQEEDSQYFDRNYSEWAGLLEAEVVNQEEFEDNEL